MDKAGNQLPYIDEVQFKFFADAQALNLAAIAGELDEQERHINLLNYPVLKENEQKLGKYKIFLWSSPGGHDAGVVFNQTYAKDPELTKLMANKDFRIAMSLADQPQADQRVRLPRHRRAAPGRSEEGPSLLPRRRVRLQVHRVRAGARPTRCSTRSA